MRGGWGGGRGGTGHFRPQPARAAAKDEEGNLIAQPPNGPPPLFPEMELPELPEISNRAKMLITRRQDLSRHSKASPFYLDTKPSTTGKDGPDAAIETFTERESKKPRTRRPPLSSVMRLDPVYFPEELYSSQDKRASKASQSRPQQEIYWKTQSSLDDADGLQNRLDRLAEMESKAGAQGGTGEGPSSAGRRDADQDVQEEALIEDEDEEEEDDYYAGNDFDDDDDGGDDGDDDGGGDALY